MSLVADYVAVLGPRARRTDAEWEVADAEAARLAVRLAVRSRAPVCGGARVAGRTTLRPAAGVITLWADELVARVGASTTVAALEEALAPFDLALGLEVAEPEESTLGGCFAAGRSGFAGPRGVHLRERCLAVAFVDGRARLLMAGSRVVKNVAGYDFGRIHHGARGSLGLLLDLTVRLVRRPADRRAVWWSCAREDLPVRLPGLRRDWGQDAAAELYVDRVAAVRFGLPGPGVVFRQYGAADQLAGRIERSGAIDVTERWDALLRRSLHRGRPLTASDLSVRDPGPDCVADLGNGVLHRATGEATPPASATARAVKRVLDPHGIFPALPGEEVGT